MKAASYRYGMTTEERVNAREIQRAEPEVGSEVPYREAETSGCRGA